MFGGHCEPGSSNEPPAVAAACAGRGERVVGVEQLAHCLGPPSNTAGDLAQAQPERLGHEDERDLEGSWIDLDHGQVGTTLTERSTDRLAHRPATWPHRRRSVSGIGPASATASSCSGVIITNCSSGT
jgi:hypothetical protein